MTDTKAEIEMVFIYSSEHYAFWRPGGAGYTQWAHEAGRWPRDEAERMTAHCGPEKKIELRSNALDAARTPKAPSSEMTPWGCAGDCDRDDGFTCADDTCAIEAGLVKRPVAPPADLVERDRETAEEVLTDILSGDLSRPWGDRAVSLIAAALTSSRAAPAPVPEDIATIRSETIERCAKVAEAYAERMRKSAEKPHPLTGRENTIALCKQDAGESLATAIRDLADAPQS
jgi:hypothetical protein